MDDGLFGKYGKLLIVRNTALEEIRTYIKKETGVILEQEEIILTKKTLSFQTSSVKKTTLRKKSVIEFLTTKGYTIKW